MVRARVPCGSPVAAASFWMRSTSPSSRALTASRVAPGYRTRDWRGHEQKEGPRERCSRRPRGGGKPGAVSGPAGRSSAARDGGGFLAVALGETLGVERLAPGGEAGDFANLAGKPGA